MIATNRSILDLFRTVAKRWWYFQELRNCGRESEARRLERDSVLEKVSSLRKVNTRGVVVIRDLGTCGYPGEAWWQYVDGNSTVTTTGGSWEFVQAAYRYGCLMVDVSHLTVGQRLRLPNPMGYADDDWREALMKFVKEVKMEGGVVFNDRNLFCDDSDV